MRRGPPAERRISELGGKAFDVRRTDQAEEAIGERGLFRIKIVGSQIESIRIDLDPLEGTDRTQPLLSSSYVFNRYFAAGVVSRNCHPPNEDQTRGRSCAN
jgi:hypothetical protein